tara:strand:- start:1944 stop:4406 length:2463 start_codon:yes stop_codon:yes gene_type:complete
MWKQECYRLCLSVHRSQKHIDRLLRIGLIDKSHVHFLYKELSKLLVDIQAIFLNNTCPKLAPELPEPMEKEILQEFSVIYSDGLSPTGAVTEITSIEEIDSQINIIKNKYAKFVKKTGMSTVSDLYMLLPKWEVDVNLVAFFDQYFCFQGWNNTEVNENLLIKIPEENNHLIMRYRGATVILNGIELHGFFISDRLSVLQKSMAYLPDQICQKIKGESGIPFQSLSIRDILVFDSETISNIISTRRELYIDLRSKTRREIVLMCKKKSIEDCIPILEILEAANMSSVFDKVCKTYPSLATAWSQITQNTTIITGTENKLLTTQISAIQTPNLPPKIQECLNKVTSQLGDGDKYDMYANVLRNFPWQAPKPIDISWEYLDTMLDRHIYGHNHAKQQIKRVVIKWKRAQTGGMVIGLCGPPGVGKTHFARSLGDTLNIPMITLHLGGQNDAEQLIGHGFTYSSARPGTLVQQMANLDSRRAIIFLDEADKTTSDQIINVLIHLTDSETNSHFQDRFFAGIEFDFSDCLIVFSYNNASSLDPILLDRVDQINIQPYLPQQKVELANDYFVPELGQMYQISENWITESQIRYIITNYTIEAGVRDLKRCLEIISAELAINEEISKPINLTKGIIRNLLKEREVTNHSKENCVHGLYATASGVGGICPIMVVPIDNNEDKGIKSTGNLGDIFKESLELADLVSKKLVGKNKNKKSFHLHVPSGATRKDGPSAGLALTIALCAFHMKRNPKSNIACTGEIDAYGNVTKIGGLVAKVVGAITAKFNVIVLPEQNKIEFDTYFKRLSKSTLEVCFVSHVSEALNIMLQ